MDDSLKDISFDKNSNQIFEFFDDFVEAYATFNGKRVASKFCFPFLSVSEGRNSRTFSNQDELAEYFQSFLEDYKVKGCVNCRYEDLRAQSLGMESVIATVTWLLSDNKNQIVLCWPESYLLRVGSGKLEAYATIDHVRHGSR